MANILHYSVLDEVAKQSPEASKLVVHLRGLSQDFKMDEILEILETVTS